MKQYGRLVVLFAAALIVVFAFYVVKRAAAPESAIIGKQRDRMAASLDKERGQKDQALARDLEDKLQLLDFRQAEAYVKENKPDKAIKMLENLIAAEQSTGKAGHRPSSSYEKEVRYYETLMMAYGVKKDEAGVERAKDQQNQLRAKAETARKSERLSEGRSVGLNGE